MKFKLTLKYVYKIKIEMYEKKEKENINEINKNI